MSLLAGLYEEPEQTAYSPTLHSQDHLGLFNFPTFGVHFLRISLAGGARHSKVQSINR